MQMVNEISRYQLVPLMFTQDAVAASQSAAAMKIVEAATNTLDATEYEIPWAFQVVGISILSDSARTADSCTVDATVNGTPDQGGGCAAVPLSENCRDDRRSVSPTSWLSQSRHFPSL